MILGGTGADAVNVGIGTTNPSTYTLQTVGTGGFSTSVNSPIFQGQAAGVTFGNSTYTTDILGAYLTVTPQINANGGLVTTSAGIIMSGVGSFSQAYTGQTSAASITADSLSGGVVLSVSSQSNVALNGDALSDLSFSGTNIFAGMTRYGSKVSVTSIGATSTNVAGYFSASGATKNYGVYSVVNGGAGAANVGIYTSASGGTTNYGLIVAAGSVGIGTTAPTAMLQVGTLANPGNARIDNGWLCVDSNGTCTGATTAGTAVSYTHLTLPTN